MTRFRFREGIAAVLLALLLASCSGEDYTPVYFPPPGGEEPGGPAASEGAGVGECTLSFTSQLCVTIKGDNIEVGTDPDEGLCTEVPAFPIHISGSTARIEGSEFPDITVEGHGLPVPIVINGRGEGDGTNNTGEGTADASGNITVNGFSFYIVALGIEAEIPGLTLTTDSSEELPQLPAAQGSPPDASGAMTLVTGTVLGHTIDAADEFLMGASLTAVFTGSISPTLAECAGTGEQSIDVQKLSIDAGGEQTAVPIPEGKYLEISSGTFIAEDDSDVGERFEASAKFRATNIGTSPVRYTIPPQKGPFLVQSLDPLTGTLAPQGSLLLTVTFRPTLANAEEGEIIESIGIGPDQFLLVGTALAQGGSASVDVVDDDGAVSAPNVGGVEVGEAAIPANSERAFFRCRTIDCDGEGAFTDCGPCADPATEPCELLPVSTEGRPMGEVDAQCALVDPDAAPLLTIDLRGTSDVSLIAQKQVIAVRNTGVEPMTITKIAIAEIAQSRSAGQFVVPEGAVFVAKRFAEIAERVGRALAGGRAQGTPLPITLPPYQPGYDETSAYIVVVYQPDDLAGSDGSQAGVGSAVTDRARLTISTDAGEITTEVSGTTTIRETPALELYFKTSVGTQNVPDGGAFSFKGITTQTVDVAVPLFLRVADTAQSALRITSIAIRGEDADVFRWLDTKARIDEVQPPAGKGMRCSIPVVDESTGEMVDEIFDLDPVALDAPGFDMAPGAYSPETMPLFGCIDFHRDPGSDISKRLYEAEVVIEAQELTAAGTPARNPDGSFRNTTLTAQLLGAINPRTGKLVLRITQTMAAILNPQFPGLSSISSFEEMKLKLDNGEAEETDLQLFTGALILDPFDEMTITTSDGADTLSTPNDGVTAIFRALDTHPVSEEYDDPFLFDFANLAYDALRPEGNRGIFEDYPNVPEGARANGWRIFTATLSYPGPVAPPEKRPSEPSQCAVVNPCSAEGLKLFTDAGAKQAGRGACAFFYASGGRYDSPALHSADEMPGGQYQNLCTMIDEPQQLLDIDTGHYRVDGRITVEEVGLRFFGPTYFHNPGGPLGPKPPLDAVFHLSFTTGMLKPQKGPEDPNVLPDERIDFAKGEHKINLTDTSLSLPPICEKNTDNAVRNGKPASSWRYLEGLLFKDEEATIPAGCPEEDNDYNGGSAFLRGRDVDPETGVVTLVTGGKFGSDDDLSFAFKDVMMFVVLNGWLCDPLGNEEEFEGSRCYDNFFNERDAVGQFSILE